MSVRSANAAAVERLVHEIERRRGARRGSSSEFRRAVPWANRRRNPRVGVADTAVTAFVEADVVDAVDLSLRGLQFWTTRRVTPGATVTIDIRWPAGPAARTLGRVVWATVEGPHPQRAARYRVGASFEAWDLTGIREILERCGLDHAGDAAARLPQ